jgi:hypothetical protein
MSIEDARELVESLVIAPECQIIKTIDLKGTLIMALDELEQYRAIGTVSELRELKEKATAKKPLNICADTGLFECLNCGRIQKILYQGFHCKECGQKLDWSEGKE